MKKRYYCKICGKETEENIKIIKECLIGTGESFEYNECEHCKSLELINIPKDMGKYYSDAYYSFKENNNFINSIMYHLKNSYFNRDNLGNILSKFLSDNEELYKLMSKMMENNKINYNSRILDVGCGSGTFLQELSYIGFKDLDGMEPFIEEEKNENGIKIYKSFLDDFNPNKTYELIFFKDSLEHMENPYLSLKKAKELLEIGGYIIITIPIKTEYFYNLYGEHWFQLDAPRHLVTFSLNGFETMINNLDLNIEETIFDSNPYSIIISEDYLKGNDMYSRKSFATKNIFVNQLRKRFRIVKLEKIGLRTIYYKLNPFIEELNEKKSSEHAIFLIRK